MDQSMNKLFKASVFKQLRVIADFADHVSFMQFFCQWVFKCDEKKNTVKTIFNIHKNCHCTKLTDIIRPKQF